MAGSGSHGRPNEGCFKDWILETIDQLRKRKARPDLERICHMLERRHGVAPLHTQAELDRLVDDESVVKVDYKGNTSYRNAAKWGRRSSLNGQVLNSTDVSRLLVSAIRELEAASRTRHGHPHASAGGVGIGTIERHLLARNPDTSLVRTKLQVALERETVATTLLKLPNGNYTAFDKAEPNSSSNNNNNTTTPPPPPPPPLAPNATTTPVPQHENSATTTTASAERNSGSPPPTLRGRRKKRPAPSSSSLSPHATPKSPPSPPPPPPAKKGRPPNKRKRFKKTHGPDFVENYDASFEEPEPKCDYCLLTAMCNCNGKPEELLFCKDCNAKAHPSCMDYSVDLAMRSRMSPWQCMDCKTCYVCDDSDDADLMLFCDSCDKGYHMGCHVPKLVAKPSGKWVCFQCTRDQRSNSTCPLLIPKEDLEFNESNDIKHAQMLDEAAGLPTPCESPVPEAEQNKRSLHFYFSKNSNLNDNKENAEIIPDASEWSIEEVENYFRRVGFAEQASAFKEQEIDGKSLLLLKRSDVLTGLSIKLGPALKIYNYVKRLQTRRPDGHLIY